MKKIEPSAELWRQSSPDEQVARAARVCYASEGGQKSPADFCAMLRKKGHLSMFRHASYYYIFEVSENASVPNWLCIALSNTPFVQCAYYKQKHLGRLYFVSTNGQFLHDYQKIADILATYEVTLDDFVARAIELHFPTALMLIRYTVCVTTQISTSREMNRTSPNNIAEQSTRYVNFGKRGGITICTPHWYAFANLSKRILARVAWKAGEWAYNLARHLGLPPQDARGFLPLDTATRVVYTYSAFEWRRIFQLRLVGTTGKPHPNAKIAAQLIHDAILPLHRLYAGDKASLT